MFDLGEDLIPLIQSPSGLMETPPLWHATIYTQVSSSLYHSITIILSNREILLISRMHIYVSSTTYLRRHVLVSSRKADCFENT